MTRVMKITFVLAAAVVALADASALTHRPGTTSLRHGGVLHPAATIALEQRSSELQAARALPTEGVTWQKATLAGVAAFAIGGLAAAAAVYFALRKKEEAKTVESQEEEGNQEAAGPSKAELDTGAGTEEDEEAREEAGIDYEQMAKLLSQRVAQLYGPKLAKAQAVKQICEDRATGFVGKARQLLLNELNSTTGAVMQEVGSEEAMLLIDFDSAVGSHFPSATVLLAGVMSPTVLMLSFYNHVVQTVVVHLPMLILCAWAAVTDRHAACGGIPTLHAWVYAQCLVAGLLAVMHVIVAAQIKSGQNTIKEKTQEMFDKIKQKGQQSPDEMGLTDVRELFICNSVLLQQALLAEEKVRRSVCNLVIGVLTTLSCFMTLWTLVLCLGWATVPGQVAMHPDAEAVVPADAFCGAWASVIAVRVVMMLSVLFLIFNLMSIVRWVGENLLTSTRYTSSMVDKAKKVDETHGLPVAETLVKAFLLRGSTDLLSSQMILAGDKMSLLEKERAVQQAKLDALQQQIDAQQDELVGLEGQEAASKDQDSEKIRASLEALEKLGEIDLSAASDEAKAQAAALQAVAERGAMSLEEAKVEAAKAEEYTKEQLDVMFGKFQDLLSQAKDSEMVTTAVAQAKHKAAEVSEQAKNFDVEAAKQKAAEVAEQASSGGSNWAKQKAAEAGDKNFWGPVADKISPKHSPR